MIHVYALIIPLKILYSITSKLPYLIIQLAFSSYLLPVNQLCITPVFDLFHPEYAFHFVMDLKLITTNQSTYNVDLEVIVAYFLYIF